MVNLMIFKLLRFNPKVEIKEILKRQIEKQQKTF